MDDLISRKSILKHIEKIRQSVQMMDDTHRADTIMKGMYLCEKAVRNQPSAQPEQRWIPCSERLPEFSVHKKDPYLGEWDNSEPVLVYCKNSEGIFESQYLIAEYTNGFLEEEQGDRNGWCGIEFADEIVDVIAWMPLPEPYDPLAGHMNEPEE